jgi:hypothetical protein
MKTETISFASLDEFLTDLGFVKTVVPDSHVAFEQARTGAVLLFRLYRPNEKVESVKLAAVRHLLVERGFIEPDRFDNLLLKTPA